MKKILIFLFIILLSISHTNAWLWLIAENWDLLNISKWNQLVSEKLYRVDLKAWDNITLTNSWSEIYINWTVSGNWVPFIGNTSQITIWKNLTENINLTWRNFTPTTTVSTTAWTITNLQIISPIELNFDLTTWSITWEFDLILANDWVLNTYWTGNWINLIKVSTSYNSCKEYYDNWYTTDWTYSLIKSWWFYDAYCDMTTDWGWWTRVVRTNWNSQEWWQKTDNYSYAANIDDTWIYDAYRYVDSFSKTMLKHIDSSTFASYDLVSVSTDTMYDLMAFCKTQTNAYSNDNAWDWARTKWMTSDYSWQKVAWTMINVDYMFICWVNEESDNDQSYLTFARSSGQTWNGYSDSWRWTNQTKTTWALLNWDYYSSNNYHIWNNYSQASAGRKADGSAGYYEVYIK